MIIPHTQNNFVEYDISNGRIINVGFISDEIIDMVVRDKHNIIHIVDWPDDFSLDLYNVDLTTNGLVKISSL